MIEIVNDEPLMDDIDVTYRYRIGLERLRKKGVDVVICWEDDDWYHHTYLDKMATMFEYYGKPDMLGIPYTIYYHLGYRMYVNLSHRKRSSMMCMAINPKSTFRYPEDSYPYLDYHLWTQNVHLTTALYKFEKPICMGIKHGIGLVGGGSHKKPNVYNVADPKFEYLQSIVDRDSFLFYSEKSKSCIKLS